MLRYAITDLSSRLGSPRSAPNSDLWPFLQADLRSWLAAGIDFVQLREKTADPGELYRLARRAMHELHAAGGSTRPRFLINGRSDVAAAARADGVHLTGRPGELTPGQARTIFRAAGLPCCTVTVSCHTLEEVAAARTGGADLVLFGPVFEKRVAGDVVTDGLGLLTLEDACRAAGHLPVLALGGITSRNSPACLAAGAAGTAGIRLFRA